MRDFDNEQFKYPEDFPGDAYTQETTKVAELKDQFGNTRFKISLTDYDNSCYPQNDDLRTFDRYFQVTVLSYCFGEKLDDPIVLLEEDFTDINEAYTRFYGLVKQYRHLINVETKGWQDINMFADKINYHKIDPDCCLNCIWSREITPENCPATEYKKHKGRLVCMNPKISKCLDDFEPYDPHHHDKAFGKCDCRHHFKFDLAPYTQIYGICDDYKRAADPKNTK